MPPLQIDLSTGVTASEKNCDNCVFKQWQFSSWAILNHQYSRLWGVLSFIPLNVPPSYLFVDKKSY